MNKFFLSFVLLFGLCLGVAFSSQADTCQVDREDDVNNPYSLRYVLETMLYDHPSPSCDASSDSYSGAEQLIKFKGTVSDITLESSKGPLQISLNKTFVIGDSDQTVVIKGRNLSSGTSPFECVDGSESVYFRNIIIETNGITDIFTGSSCLKETDSVYVCNGTVVDTDVTADGWCSGETWPAEEEEETGPTIDISNLTVGFMILPCKDEDGDGYYTLAFSSLFSWNTSNVQRVNCETVSSDKRGDCDDQSDATNPSAEELDDDQDNDCDGEIDEGLLTDTDGDGYYAEEDDCDDGNAALNPGADEVCDSVDNDCDGTVDEDSVCNICTDYDEDGYPVESDLCTATEYDCVDNNAEISPAATDVCGDGIDQNCSGSDCSNEVCGDSLDNDENDLADCSDASCTSYSSCNNLNAETICNDSLDDDGDEALDCADADCAQFGVCTGEPETLCGDGLDNDGDGTFDCDDSDCYNVVFDPQTGEACPSGEIIAETGSSSGCGCYLGAGGAAAGQVGYLGLSSLFVGLWWVVRRSSSVFR